MTIPAGAAFQIAYGVQDGKAGWVVGRIQTFGVEMLSEPLATPQEAQQWLITLIASAAWPPVYYDAGGNIIGADRTILARLVQMAQSVPNAV